MRQLYELLNTLDNFNLIKYTDHHVLTIDRGMGRPIIIEGDTLVDIETGLSSYMEGL